MIKKVFQHLLAAVVFITSIHCYSQPSCSFEHYSIENGLMPSSINAIHQDKTGYIWLATYDGLIRFDGYDFQNFKIHSNESYIAQSNRIDKITEDKYGRLWLKSADDAYCFIPDIETFWGVKSSTQHSNFNILKPDLKVMPSGKVWLYSKTEGCVCIKDSLFTLELYNRKNRKLVNDTIHDIFEDSQLNTWILTDKGIGLIPPNSSEIISLNQPNTSEQLPKNQPVYCAYETDKEVWFGSTSGIVFSYSKALRTLRKFQTQTKSNIFKIFKLNDDCHLFITASDGFICYQQSSGVQTKYNASNIRSLTTNVIEDVFINAPYQFWFTSSSTGIYKFDILTNNIKHYQVQVEEQSINASSPNAFILKDATNNLWIHPRGGGFSFYDVKKDALVPFYNDINDTQNKFSNILHSALFDRQGNLWFCTRSHGLEKASFNSKYFTSRQPNSKIATSLSNNIRAIYQDKDGLVWMANKEGRLLMYDAHLQYIGEMSAEGKLVQQAQWPANIYCIMQAADNTMWVGTRGSGVYHFTKTQTGLNYHVSHFEQDESDVYSLSNNNVYEIAQDDVQNIWIATLGGGVNLLKKTPGDSYRFINSNNDLQHYPIAYCDRVRCITQGPNGMLYAGTSDGLLVWENNFKEPQNIQFQHYTNADENDHNLSNNEIMDIVVTDKKELFLGTYGGGINKITSYSTEGYPQGFIQFGEEAGLPSEIILNMQEDFKHQIWISTENDLVRFTPENNLFETFKAVNKLLDGNIFSESASVELKNNSLLIGYLDGIIQFSPEQVASNSYTPYLALSNFRIFNKPVLNRDDAPFEGSVNNASEIQLAHTQNFFDIGFSALDFINSKEILYAYKLEGFDKEWNYTRKRRFVNYTNIPKGAYTFRVKSTNGSGVWVNNERKLPITIQPSFWETPLAYTLYLVLFLLIFFLIQRNILYIYKLRGDIKLQKKMSEMKLKFFTDISHEIRTPLTLITSPVEKLLNDHHLTSDAKQQVAFISQSTTRLLKLVNQILDFRKVLEQPLKIEEINLRHFTEKICSDFVEIAKDKNLHFDYSKLGSDVLLWADSDALEKIVMNLLSNAFKYCHSGDRIEVVISDNEKNVNLEIKDSGPGISKEKQKEMFDRFASFNEDSSNPSTGIGLSMVKEIADKHFASVVVESESGKGASFTVRFLKGFHHFGSEIEMLPRDSTVELLQDEISETIISEPELTSRKSEKLSILIVEDDDGLRAFIKSILADDYLVMEAGDGNEGVQLALTKNPNVIVSDIMMPKKDGIELLQELRGNSETSHIPIVLLTAKTDIDSKLEGLSFGADDYITKPFSVSYFKARISNLIKQRERVHAFYRSDRNVFSLQEKEAQLPIVSADELFMQKVMDSITENLDNTTFSVEELGKQVGLSRTTCFNKIKSLTGMSPVEFIRNERLKQAAYLIRTETLLIKEICYMTGFSDIRYFGKCFKTKYGITPMQYRSGE